MASAEDDLRMKNLAVPEGAGLVYLYRNETLGYSISMPVTMDGVADGTTVAKTFMIWQLAPGTHTVTSEAENTTRLDIAVMPGGRYYVWQEVKAGVWKARSQLQLVPATTGQAGVNECHLIKMRLPSPPRPAAAPTAPHAAPVRPGEAPPPPTS